MGLISEVEDRLRSFAYLHYRAKDDDNTLFKPAFALYSQNKMPSIQSAGLLERSEFDVPWTGPGLSPGIIELIIVLTIPGFVLILCLLSCWYNHRHHNNDKDEDKLELEGV
jgi:hypothetical protein